jgi:hypothetical protein
LRASLMPRNALIRPNAWRSQTSSSMAIQSRPTAVERSKHHRRSPTRSCIDVTGAIVPTVAYVAMPIETASNARASCVRKATASHNGRLRISGKLSHTQFGYARWYALCCLRLQDECWSPIHAQCF